MGQIKEIYGIAHVYKLICNSSWMALYLFSYLTNLKKNDAIRTKQKNYTCIEWHIQLNMIKFQQIIKEQVNFQYHQKAFL